MAQQMNKHTDCNGCPSKVKVEGKIVCLEKEIEPDQPVEGCSDRGKGRAACNLSPQELRDFKDQFSSESKGSSYYDPFERRNW